MMPINHSEHWYSMPPPPRPESPTFLRLLSLAEREQKGELAVPDRPAQVRRATIEEWGAVQSFRNNIDHADPSGEMRKRGEFFQTFSSKPEELDYVENHPIHFQTGSRVDPPPASAFPEGTTEMAHSHPPAPRGTDNEFPSAQDYLGTYLLNRGNEKSIGSILYHVGTGHAYAFAGKVDPRTNLPEFHRLTQPSLQDNMEWLQKHGHADPLPAPTARRPARTGSPPEGGMFVMDEDL